eukprot:scaffold47308_cov61-Phaeocystis_antarctica.AAC.3
MTARGQPGRAGLRPRDLARRGHARRPRRNRRRDRAGGVGQPHAADGQRPLRPRVDAGAGLGGGGARADVRARTGGDPRSTG